MRWITEDWSKVVDYIIKCRHDGGYPVLKDRLFFLEAPEDGIWMHCWGGRGEAPDLVLFTGVPKEDKELIRVTKRDWEYILAKYGVSREKIEELKKEPLVLGAYKLKVH